MGNSSWIKDQILGGGAFETLGKVADALDFGAKVRRRANRVLDVATTATELLGSEDATERDSLPSPGPASHAGRTEDSRPCSAPESPPGGAVSEASERGKEDSGVEPREKVSV